MWVMTAYGETTPISFYRFLTVVAIDGDISKAGQGGSDPCGLLDYLKEAQCFVKIFGCLPEVAAPSLDIPKSEERAGCVEAIAEAPLLGNCLVKQFRRTVVVALSN